VEVKEIPVCNAKAWTGKGSFGCGGSCASHSTIFGVC
jgi:hypothetical protein